MSETESPDHAREAARYLAAAVDEVHFYRDRKDDSPVRLLLALYGASQAVLALDSRLADIADSVTGLQAAVEKLTAGETVLPRRRSWWAARRQARGAR
jgi:hypothetical protein